MSSSGYESTDLLAQFNAKANRPLSETGSTGPVTDTQKYDLLARSQDRIIGMMSAVAPNSLYPKVAYGSLPTLTTTDNQVYTFGTDGRGYATFPMGKGGIFRSLNDIPFNPLVPGQDYMIEGTQIRCPSNQTLPSVLYWYGIVAPLPITATNQPALFPEMARELIVIDAVRQFAQGGKRDTDLMDMMATEWGYPLTNNNGAWAQWCLVWKTQFRDGGALNVFTGRQLAVTGAFGGINSF